MTEATTILTRVDRNVRQLRNECKRFSVYVLTSKKCRHEAAFQRKSMGWQIPRGCSHGELRVRSASGHHAKAGTRPNPAVQGGIGSAAGIRVHRSPRTADQERQCRG